MLCPCALCSCWVVAFGAGLRPPTKYGVMRMKGVSAGHFSSTNGSHEGFFTKVQVMIPLKRVKRHYKGHKQGQFSGLGPR